MDPDCVCPQIWRPVRKTSNFSGAATLLFALSLRGWQGVRCSPRTGSWRPPFGDHAREPMAGVPVG
eukprot:3185160-Alexandrium_andersonii.AAC.1